MDAKDIENLPYRPLTGIAPTWAPRQTRSGICPSRSAYRWATDRRNVRKTTAITTARARPERKFDAAADKELDTLRLPHGAPDRAKAPDLRNCAAVHPSNGGDRGAERALKKVIKAGGAARSGDLTYRKA